MKKIAILVLGALMNLYSHPIDIKIEEGICIIDGAERPLIGFGTYPLQDSICTQAIENAARCGYQIIDTATFYNNFKAIAKALKGQNRSDFYIISKVWHDMQSPENLRRDLDSTLEQLETDYLDAYLIHWPNNQIPIDQTLSEMEKLIQEKKIRHIGLSNVSVNHLKKVLEFNIPITWVQVEMHPYFYDHELLEFCFEHPITIQAWRPLDLGQVREDQILLEIGKKYDKTACQVALRWIIQHGCLPLPGSQNEQHILENGNIFDFSLSSKEMEKIDQRAVKGNRWRLKEETGFGFTDEFDFSYEDCWPISSLSR